MKKVGIFVFLVLGCSVDRNGGGDSGEGGTAGASGGNKTGGGGAVAKGGNNAGGNSSGGRGGSNNGGSTNGGGDMASGGRDDSQGGSTSGAGGMLTSGGAGGMPSAGGAGGTLPTNGGSLNGGSGGAVPTGGKLSTGGTSAGGSTAGGTTSGGTASGGKVATGGTAAGGAASGGKASGGTASGGKASGGASSCPGGGTPKARDCTSSADNDCDGKADNTIDTVCTCVIGQVQTCDTHPGLDGTGTCKAGTQTCVAGTGNSTTSFGGCQGAVGPTIEACTANGLDEDCDALYNETPPCAERYEQVSAGTFTTCGVALNGYVLCWGRNESGQLGQGFTDTSPHATPSSVSISKVAEVSVGTTHVCARQFSGTVRCWGSNQFGQLGNGTKTNSANPVLVTGLENATQISVGSTHSCAVRTDGTAVCWGAGDFGILGNRATTGSTTPTAVVGLASIASITATSSSTTCARLTSGAVYCWGDDTHGELGNGSADGNPGSMIPVQVTGLTGITQLDGNLARKSDNTLWFWGENEYGQAGTGEKGTGGPVAIEYYAPVQVSSVTVAKQATRGGQSSCAVMNDGTVRCFGTNNNGSLGVGSSASSFTPVAVPGLSNVASVDCGTDGHCCALLSDGTLRCWGSNQYGQLGDGTTTNRLAPVVGPAPY